MLIVDAYNVLHCTHELDDRYAMIDVAGLCRLIETSRWSNAPAAVVCDGVPKPNEGSYLGPVDLVYAGRGRDADTLIEQLIEDADNPQHTTVVSNDRRLVRAARRRRCRTLSSQRFLRLVTARTPPPEEPEKPQHVDNAEAWMAAFDLDEDDPMAIERQPIDPPAETNRQPGRSNPAAIDDSPELTDEPKPGESETDFWLREFGLDDGRKRDIDGT